MSNTIQVGILMGSDSDLVIMKEASDILNEFGITNEMKIISAHRSPHLLAEYASNAHERGMKVFIAGAGAAAHLPGVTAAFTPLPVIFRCEFRKKSHLFFCPKFHLTEIDPI